MEAGLTLLADPDRLGQVLRALIDNAVKFSDGRGSVLVRGTRATPGTVLIEVIDQGIGIPAEDVPRIFERFFQVDNTATRRFGGTGMGLALVKRVVEAHGATVDVETRARLRDAHRAALAGASAAPVDVPDGSRRGVAGAGTMRVVALGGALAVPCTRNPL